MASFAGDRTGGSIAPISLQSGASGGNYSAAAGVVDLNKNFWAQKSKAPAWGELSAQAMKNAADEKNTAIAAESNAFGKGMETYGQTFGQAMQAKATIEAAEKQAEAQKSSGMMSAIGGIAGAGLKLLSGGLAG